MVRTFVNRGSQPISGYPPGRFRSTFPPIKRPRIFSYLAALALVSVALTGAPAEAQHLTAERPNVVIIVTDDQPQGALDAMPNVVGDLVANGVLFTQGYIPTSLCCPSRSSLLTGNYAHTTGVWTNSTTDGIGGWPAFHDNGNEQSTLATRLHDAGYYTGLFGKYLNGFAHANRDPPPGWDHFVFLDPDGGGDGSYYDYTLGGTIPDEHYGETPADYSTDVVGNYATNYVLNAPTDQPLFLYFAPYGPHPPMLPAPRDAGTWPLEPAKNIPGLNEANLSDKPLWVQNNSPVKSIVQRQEYTQQHEALMAVDDAVGNIVDALGPERAANTLFVFLSDNGFMLGAHRITGKDVPYDRSTRVPMLMRWDGHIQPGITDDRPTLNIDLTATIATAADVAWPMEGRSYFTQVRTGTVLEQTASNKHPAYCGYRTRKYLFVQYNVGEGAELYDYTTDPNELRNKIDKKSYAAIVAKLRAKAMLRCVPVPPGFAWE